MKFKTRLIITFITIILLPLVLTSVAFWGISTILVRDARISYGTEPKNYAIIADSVEAFNEITEKIYNSLWEKADAHATDLEDKTYLQSISDELDSSYAYIVVRKNDSVYFTGNQIAAEKLFEMLPAYGQGTFNRETGYYYNDLQKLVRQVDFTFADGSEGSLFIVTKISSVISRPLFADMMVAIILILLFTSLMLTRWIHKSIYLPVKELNIAMQNISEGNLDFHLPTDTKGEFGELYKNYEEMRLKLKESTEDNFNGEKQNRELISNISHDLKTPITSIKGYVEGIMDGVADTPDKMDKYIKTIYNKANDMDRLINELTLYSGIDSNRIPYNFHRIVVADYFGDCVEEVGLDLESKNIVLNYFNLVDPNTKIIADPEQMKRVINNIIGNSIKYIDKDKGVIDIRILDEVDSIRVEIEDNGKGIAQKDLGNIFDRFYRTDASRNSAQGGSGIGLSIVKKIVEDHGGYIWATSKENEGTCLHFVIRKYREVENNEQNIDY